jgi:YVTN family beta-propeller protein
VLALAANSSTNLVYVADWTNNQVFVVDGNTKATQTVPVGTNPSALAINAKTNQIWVASGSGSSSSPGSVTVINGATRTTTKIALSATLSPTAIAVSPQTNMVYVAGYSASAGYVTVINGATNAIAATLTVGQHPTSLALDTAANKIYVGDSNAGTVTAIDGTTNTVQATVAAPHFPGQLAVNPLTGMVYACGYPTLTVLDGQSNSVVNRFAFQNVCALGVDATRSRVYIAATSEDSQHASLGIMDGGKNITGMVGVFGSFSGETAPPYYNARSLVFDSQTGTVFVVEPPSVSFAPTQLKVFQQPGRTMLGDLLQYSSVAPLSMSAQKLASGWSTPYVAANPISIVTVLLIHGRTGSQAPYPNGNGNYGAFSNDLLNDGSHYWPAPPATGPRLLTGQTFPTGFYASQVIYVQWDSWTRSFTDTTSGHGGWAIVNSAMNQFCRLGTTPPNNLGSTAPGGGCVVICHSAGCAAFENWLSKANFNNGYYFSEIITAGSAAGGSELADNFYNWPGVFGTGPIDQYLTTTYTRSAYNHNNMQGQSLHAIAGTQYDPNIVAETLFQCQVWPLVPLQTPLQPGAYNSGCSANGQPNYCPLAGGKVGLECIDSDVSLHSSCAHTTPAGFQGCGSKLPPNNDSTTFNYHGYWGKGPFWDGAPFPNCCAPFSYYGYLYNPTYHTYRVDHSGTRTLAIEEYSACNLRGLPNCP